MPKRLLPNVPMATLHRPSAFVAPYNSLLLCLGNSTASITARRGRCSPSTHGVLLSTQTCLRNGKLALRFCHKSSNYNSYQFGPFLGLPYTTPYCLPHGPYELLMASHILGVWPANILCKFFFYTPERLLQKVPMATPHRPSAPAAPYNSLLLCLGNSTASITTRRGRCSPSTHGVLLSTQTCPQNGKSAL